MINFQPFIKQLSICHPNWLKGKIYSIFIRRSLDQKPFGKAGFGPINGCHLLLSPEVRHLPIIHNSKRGCCCRSLLLLQNGYPEEFLLRIYMGILVVAGANSCNGHGLLKLRICIIYRIFIVVYKR